MRKLLLLSLLSFFCFEIAAQNIWDKRAACGGSKRERGVSFSIGSRGYIGLGQDTLNMMCNDLWEYDPGTNSWTQKANFPGVARRDAASFVIGTKAYVGTGMDNADAWVGNQLSDFYEYSPATNSWTAKAPFPGNSGMGIYYTFGFSVSGKGYFCCGKNGASSYSKNLWEYTPTTNTWLQKADCPGTTRYGGVGFVIGNIAYFGTGTDENILTNDWFKYNAATNTWTTLLNFPGTGRFSCSAFVVLNKGYIMMGTDGGYKDELWQYDESIDYWFPKATFPGGARRSAGSFAIGGRGYAGTGKGLTGTRRDFWVYYPSTTVGMEEHAEDVFSNVYPNPMVDQSTVVISEQIFQNDPNLYYDLISMEGKIITSDKINASTFMISRGDLPSGLYFVSIRSGQKRLAHKKMLVR